MESPSFLPTITDNLKKRITATQEANIIVVQTASKTLKQADFPPECQDKARKVKLLEMRQPFLFIYRQKFREFACSL